MSELYEQSLIKLELDRVLALLADKAGCPAAAERCRALRPMTEPDDVRRALPVRRRNFHKGDAGRLLIVAGSFGMAGAAAMAASAAVHAGAGLVTVACPAA